jgi:hypothetical protein
MLLPWIPAKLRFVPNARAAEKKLLAYRRDDRG